MTDTSELYARGLVRRKRMFGEAEVDKRMAASGEFGAPLQTIINAMPSGTYGCPLLWRACERHC